MSFLKICFSPFPQPILPSKYSLNVISFYHLHNYRSIPTHLQLSSKLQQTHNLPHSFHSLPHSSQGELFKSQSYHILLLTHLNSFQGFPHTENLIKIPNPYLHHVAIFYFSNLIFYYVPSFIHITTYPVSSNNCFHTSSLYKPQYLNA